MREMIINTLEGVNPDGSTDSRYVATFGNSDVLTTGDWVPIVKPYIPAASVRIYIC